MAVDPTLFDDLAARGLVHDTTDRVALESRLSAGPITAYVGFDPTADSLHVGNLIGLLCLRRLQDAGHRPISLAGGATGMVGANLEGIVPQLKKFIDFERAGNPAKLLDNRAWTVGVSMLDFLRDVGKYITVNQMIAKESVKARIESTSGISYTEFSYMLLQANDFAWLYENEGCEMQMGGSDQWGNITAGADLIRKRLGGSAYALTWPLLTKPDGTKYGKTAGGDTIWLSPHRLSPYRFYQAWLQADDGDLEKLLLQLTLLSVDAVRDAVAAHQVEPQRRSGQRLLAKELTEIVHGEAATDSAIAATAVVFGGQAASKLSSETLEVLAEELPVADLPRSALEQNDNVASLLLTGEVVSSKGEAARLVKQNGVSINDVKAELGQSIGTDQLLAGRYLLVRKGKRNVYLLRFSG